LDLSRIRPATIALIVAAIVMLLVGAYTENSGFQLAGLILGVVAVITALNQARSRSDTGEGEPK
jgi:uncharacterized membrane protein